MIDWLQVDREVITPDGVATVRRITEDDGVYTSKGNYCRTELKPILVIDWDKPLECEHGPVMIIRRECDESINIRTMDGLITWWVDLDGNDLSKDKWMPKVYNAKRKPKKGELWWCKWELQVGNEEFKWFKEPVRFDGEKFPLVPDHAKHLEILEPYKEQE